LLLLFLSLPPPPTAFSTLSLHDALPIFRSGHSKREPRLSDSRLTVPSSRDPIEVSRLSQALCASVLVRATTRAPRRRVSRIVSRDRKSTCLNSSHDQISYAVFCLKKKKK